MDGERKLLVALGRECFLLFAESLLGRRFAGARCAALAESAAGGLGGRCRGQELVEPGKATGAAYLAEDDFLVG